MVFSVGVFNVDKIFVGWGCCGRKVSGEFFCKWSIFLVNFSIDLLVLSVFVLFSVFFFSEKRKNEIFCWKRRKKRQGEKRSTSLTSRSYFKLVIRIHFRGGFFVGFREKKGYYFVIFARVSENVFLDGKLGKIFCCFLRR